MTAIINRFEAENPDIKVIENVVFWPGYDQLTAQLAANDAPDLVTMHGSVISDYQARGLLEPMGELLAVAGVRTDDLTDAARRAVTIEGELWSAPIDTWAPLWHINLNYFREARLIGDGEPLLPRSPDELYAHARRFRERIGKPYFVQGTANEYAGFARNFYTFAMQQGAELYTADGRANFQTLEATRALALFKTIFEENHTTRNQDYSAAVAGFMRGDGGVFLVGTWMVGTFDARSKEPGNPLSGGYIVVPYPQLFAYDVVYADGHNWVMPRNDKRSPATREAAVRFLRFFTAHNFDWSRTGHLPVFKSIIESEAWRSLPYRPQLAKLAEIATPLPKQVRRQFPIETIIGQEAAAAISGAKTIPQALADMERRVNDILDHI
ncbi:extracellular solute-binding protein [Amphiplicatus metriothermophilus]|nr:extracellular solute-binding protein [Amphiplicatus metriothermophilus]MBB5519813.1 multiple sugar transport system substrate-binding protein [Amphiplicatus metriothermophilus]